MYRVVALLVYNRRGGRSGITSSAFNNILLVVFMIVCRIVLVFGWCYIGMYKVSALFVCNKRSGRRYIAYIACTSIALVW